MSLDVPAVQQALRQQGIDGWLLYDFHGSNPIASRVTGLAGSPKMTTRRWFYLIPREGEPRGLVHAIERHNLPQLPGDKRTYTGRVSLERELAQLLEGMKRVAMEYSPRCEIPYISRVDAGTMEMVRQCGVEEVVSSGDLVQQFEAVWSDKAFRAHRRASEALYAIKDQTFEIIGRRLADGRATTEYDIQQLMVAHFRERGLVSDSAPVVAVGSNAANPHYLPTEAAHRPIVADAVVLLDLWGKLPQPGAVYADITWVGYTGTTVPPSVARAFQAIRDAREAAIALVERAAGEKRDLRGWEVDRAARTVLEQAGFGPQILHRTGHSLGEDVHGNGVHMDDYETHDDRRLLPGTGFTIEPGLYFEDFGVRTEINMFFGSGEAFVTGPRQTEVVRLV